MYNKQRKCSAEYADHRTYMYLPQSKAISLSRNQVSFSALIRSWFFTNLCQCTL